MAERHNLTPQALSAPVDNMQLGAKPRVRIPAGSTARLEGGNAQPVNTKVTTTDKAWMTSDSFQNFLTALGMEPVILPTGAESRYQPTVAMLEALDPRPAGLIVASQGEGSLLARAIGRDLKCKASPIIYVVAIAAAFLAPWLAGALYALVAVMWLIPDRRIERAFAAREEP